MHYALLASLRIKYIKTVVKIDACYCTFLMTLFIELAEASNSAKDLKIYLFQRLYSKTNMVYGTLYAGVL